LSFPAPRPKRRMNVQHHFELASAAHIVPLLKLCSPILFRAFALPFAQDATLCLFSLQFTWEPSGKPVLSSLTSTPTVSVTPFVCPHHGNILLCLLPFHLSSPSNLRNTIALKSGVVYRENRSCSSLSGTYMALASIFSTFLGAIDLSPHSIVPCPNSFSTPDDFRPSEHLPAC
jgi:hypothetical protein